MPRLDADRELRALDLFGRLNERPADSLYRQRLLRRADPEVVARIADLERSASAAARAMPTDLPPPSQPPSQPPAPPPEQVGAFRLTQLLGEGGMGRVYRGERCDGLFDQAVAVKLLHAHLTRLAATRFAEERRILARLEHPNISRLIDGGVLADGTPYLVMEFVAGRPIDEVAAGQGDKAKVALLRQVADAVQFAHAQLIVHADLKPSNMLVDASGRVRLLDFGVARLLGEEGVEVAHPMTPDYASPERTAGAPAVVADDVYALGLVLEQLVAGTRDKDLLAIAAKARAAAAADRYGSVAALIADLDRWRERLPVEARDGGVVYRAGRFVDRHRLGVALTVGAMVALSATTVVATVSYVRAEQARAEARARFEQAHGAARYLLFDLGERLERQPQALALRAEVARFSQSYLDQLARSDGAPASLRLESAQGLMALAERQGMPGRPNLGQSEQAKRNLATAYALALTAPGQEGRRLRAQTRLDQAHLTVLMDNDFPATERLLADARALIFDAKAPIPDLQRDWYAETSALRQWQGRYAEATTAALTGLRTPAPSDLRQAMLSEAKLEDLLAEAAAYDGRTDDAIAPYRRRMAILEAAARRWPGDPQVTRLLPRSRWALGATLLDAGRSREAAPILAQGVAEARAVAAFEPQDADAERAADIIENTQAQTFAAMGQPETAIPILARSAEARRRRMLARPGVALGARDYAITLAALGDVEGQAGRRGEACRRYDQAEQIFDDLRRRGHAAALDTDGARKLLELSRARYCRR